MAQCADREDDGQSRALRRRVTLIYSVVTPVARGRAHMTVLRREDVQSRVASWDKRPYRMSRSPILAIVPLIIRRLRGPSRTRVIPFRSSELFSTIIPSLRRLERRPQKARQLARDGHRRLRRRLVVFHQASEPATQSLLCPVRNRDHAARLPFAAARERWPDPCPMLVVPRSFHQQSPNQRIPGAGDATAPVLLATRIFARHQPHIRHQRPWVV